VLVCVVPFFGDAHGVSARIAPSCAFIARDRQATTNAHLRPRCHIDVTLDKRLAGDGIIGRCRQRPSPHVRRVLAFRVAHRRLAGRGGNGGPTSWAATA
jgi:hypothetical protein